MKITQNEYDIQMSEGFQTKSFGLEINAKAFDILVNKIYTDKIGAIVRELSANAYDSHVDAGNLATPFEIHLPNTMEPYFHIRDYGTGISEEKMYDVYTRVFKSDKTGSNDFVGCMGLGSKTPFCYTDQFTIISYLNGIQYCYFAHKDTRGIPSISASSENGSLTNEPNGLKVSFSVKNSYDYSVFKTKVQDFLRYYTVKPRIIGQNIQFKLDSILFENDKFRISSFDNNHNSVLLMGNIPYKIPWCTAIDNTVFKAKIGSIEIEASRESIEDVTHNKHQLAILESEAISVLNQLKKDIVSDITNRVECNWNANRKLHELSMIFNDSTVGRDYEIPSYVKYIQTYAPKRKPYKCSIRPDNIININKITDGGKYMFIKYTFNNLIKKRQFDWLSENFNHSVVIAFTDDKEQEAIKHFEILPEYVYDVSDIPLNPITPRVKKTTSTIVGWKKFKGHHSYSNHCWVDDTNFNPQENVLCCRKNANILIGSTEYSPVIITKFLSSIGNKTIMYGLNINEYKKYKLNNNFIEFETWIKNAIINYIKSNNNFSNVLTYQSLEYDKKSTYDFLVEAKTWIPKPICKDINCNDFIDLNISYKDDYKYEKLYKFAKELDKNFEIPLNSRVIDGIETYNKKYKIIELVQHEPEYRKEFFKLILGAKKYVTSN